MTNAQAILANPSATVDELCRIVDGYQVEVARHPSCPPSMFWYLFSRHPVAVFGSTTAQLMILEDPASYRRTVNQQLHNWLRGLCESVPEDERRLEIEIGQRQWLLAEVGDLYLAHLNVELPDELRTKVQATQEARRRVPKENVASKELHDADRVLTSWLESPQGLSFQPLLRAFAESVYPKRGIAMLLYSANEYLNCDIEAWRVEVWQRVHPLLREWTSP